MRFHRSIFSCFFIASAVIVVAGGTSGAALADPPLQVTFADHPYAFAERCDLADPIVFLKAKVRNVGAARAAPAAILVVDDPHVFFGEHSVPSLAPGKSVDLHIPLQIDTRPNPLKPPLGPGGIAGAHAFTIWLQTSGLPSPATAPLSVSVPAALCAAVVPKVTPAPVVAATTTPAANPIVSQTITERSKSLVLATLSKIAPPTNLKSASNGADCVAHLGLAGALVCPDMLKSGSLLLVWDWQAQSGPDAIDGYRVYHTNGLSRLPVVVATVRNGKAQTLAMLAKSANYSGSCYAVSAFSGNRESALGPTFCAGAGSVAKFVTTRLLANHSLSSGRSKSQATPLTVKSFGADPFAASDRVVGFSYSEDKRLVGDRYSNAIDRAAFAFDVSGLQNRRLVSATLRLTIAQSYGAGNNHSCANVIGTGTEFWWKQDAQHWIDGQFDDNVGLTDTGPEISGDMTSIVKRWLSGEPNYGFVLKNADENVDAFTNKQCQTSYVNPVLEIVTY